MLNEAARLIPKPEAGKPTLGTPGDASGSLAADANFDFERQLRGVFTRVEPLDPLPLRVAIKCGRTVVFLDPTQVVAAEAHGNYVLFRCQGDSHRVRVSIREVAVKLGRYGFIRIHRSTVVNANCVKGIELSALGACVLRVCGGREYQVSQNYRENLRTLAPVWLGGRGLAAEED